MNTATATATVDRIEWLGSNTAWQLAEHALALASRAAKAPATVLRRVAALPDAWRLATETRRAEEAFSRLSDHRLRDLGVHRTDLLLRFGARPRRREI